MAVERPVLRLQPERVSLLLEKVRHRRYTQAEAAAIQEDPKAYSLLLRQLYANRGVSR